MSDKKGFTLVEIIVAMVIIALLSALAIPGYLASQIQGSAKAAQNNLITIFNAEKNFYLSNIPVGVGATAYYCTISTQNTTCADNLADINTNLKLNISDPYFSYSCTDPNSGTDGNNGSGFQCVATNLTNNNFKLTVNGGTAASPQFIVVPGGNGCTIGSTASCNPSCVDVLNPSYCPSAAN